MTLRVLIADDQRVARDRLRHLLEAEPGIEIVGECATGTETVEAIQNESPHVVFLDVRMPELDGFGVIRALDADRSPIVIFVTAHDRFALRAFDVTPQIICSSRLIANGSEMQSAVLGNVRKERENIRQPKRFSNPLRT